MKIAPVEVFKDPNAEAILDLKKFNPIRHPPATHEIVGQVKEMAASPAVPVDPTVIRRFVLGMVSRAHRHAQHPGADRSSARNCLATSPSMQAIETATTNLIEPLFVARANKSNQFLKEYNRVLLANLPPLLKHHLVPRIQAMIVLGQSANPELYKLFLDEIKNQKQTVWVKLWAIRGITNIVRLNPTPRLNAEPGQ